MNPVHKNIASVLEVARGLGDLNAEVVYVGGAVVGLYVDDPGAEEPRPTIDVDIALDIGNLSELEKLRTQLTQQGFSQSAEDDIICRFRFKDNLVDVMATKAVGWAPSNPWFRDGFQHKEAISISGEIIQILPLPYFLATKIVAFRDPDRGSLDPRTSRDFEDITYLLDNRKSLQDDISSAPTNVKHFLIPFFREIINSDPLQEAIIANLDPELQMERFHKIMVKLKLLGLQS